MQKLTTLAFGSVLVLCAGAAGAQVSKTIQGELKTVSATVESIERSSREVTIKKADGTFDVVYVPEGVARFDALKVGDTVKARYYENVVLRLKAPGETTTDTASSATTPTEGAKPAGTIARQRTITAKIAAIDRKVPSITFTGPNGWTYSSRVQDKEALAKVKVGDQVEITWTTAMLVSFAEGS